MTPTTCERGPHRQPPRFQETDVDQGRGVPSALLACSLPPLGAGITVEFPTAVVPQQRSGPYVVVDVDGQDTLTARPVAGDPPVAAVGTPCLIHSTCGAERSTREAILLSSGPGGIVVQVHVADQHHQPHCRRQMAALVEVLGTTLGLIEGVTEDVSLSDVRLQVPVEAPADRRAFISLHEVGSPPICAIARILACGPTLDEGTFFLRAELTLVAPHDQLRLFSLTDWSAISSGAGVAGHSPLLRQLVRLVSAATARPGRR